MKSAVLAGVLMMCFGTAFAWKLPEGSSAAIVPGVGAGPVDLETGRERLGELFPAAALTDTSVHMGEGFYQRGTEVFAGTGMHLSIAWQDDAMLAPSRITVLGSAWAAPEGVRVGMTLFEVERLAGGFRLTGFGWDYGGTADMSGTPLDGLLLRFGVPEGADLSASGVMGDGYFPSDDAGMRSLSPVLRSIAVVAETE